MINQAAIPSVGGSTKPVMEQTLLSERQRLALRELIAQAAERVRAEEATAETFRVSKEAADKEHRQLLDRLEKQFTHAFLAADEKVQIARELAVSQHETEHRALTQEFSGAKHKAKYIYSTSKERIETEFKESRWTIHTIYDSDKKASKDQLAKTQSKVEASYTKVKEFHQEALNQLNEWKMTGLEPTTVENQVSGEIDPFKALQQCSVQAGKRAVELVRLTTPDWVKGYRFHVLAVLAVAVTAAPAFLMGDTWYIWLLANVALAVVVSVLLFTYLAQSARRQAAALFHPICQARVDAKILRKRCLEIARTTYKEQRAASKIQNQQALKKAYKKCRQEVRDILAQRNRELAAAEKTFPPRLAELERKRENELNQAETMHQLQIADLTQRREQELASLNEKFSRLREDISRRHANDWGKLATAWKQACGRFQATSQEIDQACRQRFAPWADPIWQKWPMPTTVPMGMRFGELGVKAELIPHGIPADPQLPRLALDGLTFPALLSFPERASLLLKTNDEGRQRALETLEALMMRFLTGLPPGKVRFTILDPLGRGEQFAAFMHLADYEELLLTSRIWTEAVHIEQRLVDLTEHMENVIQKYLRNQFETLEEYNAQAGEVAEPYRLLVVANFPTCFSPDSARRLLSLATSGARCGIYTLISVDTRQPVPQGFNLVDLERACLTLTLRDQEFVWNDTDFSPFPLRLDRPPDAETENKLIHQAGQEAKRVGRVEVPFEFVAPTPDHYWKSDSRSGIAVPLGRAGALQRQNLVLGQGTSQHALIAGKTGSGKSTLLHALITQLALNYSPDEVELYLIDFKKGVEFKTYATHELPHARVVAVESEREFGLSVLQRLDGELKFRGERFRELGVTDLNAYRAEMDSVRQKGGDEIVMPRILLIVDEFQEFFVEDDKIAQESALLLDRLVRQGRAFGMHILLGSQTLGGAYSLARSTIDQMAVRIALQCSEADAHLILSKDNSAARLLTRPGEAIYNAANGMLEGNNLFQIVWLSDERRDNYLERVSAMARSHNGKPRSLIVFEGMAPSELPKNAALQNLMQHGPPAAPTVWTAWLGEAIAIKEPTAAVFKKQSGSNLLMVGQQGEAAFNLLAAAAVGLAAQVSDATSPTIFFVPGVPPEGGGEPVLEALASHLAPRLKVVASRDLPALMAQFAEELDRRMKNPGHAEPQFLLLYGLHRLRDLRKEEEFGFGKKEEKASPAKIFANVLREGPTVGLFTVVWCDNLNNLNRALDRQMLREFELRVLFQMSAADSSNLIDSPMAAKLGMHRALYYTEDQGRMEKFRPYGLLSPDWLASLRKHSHSRSDR